MPFIWARAWSLASERRYFMAFPVDSERDHHAPKRASSVSVNRGRCHAASPLTMFAGSPTTPQKAWNVRNFELVNSLTLGKLPFGCGRFGLRSLDDEARCVGCRHILGGPFDRRVPEGPGRAEPRNLVG